MNNFNGMLGSWFRFLDEYALGHKGGRGLTLLLTGFISAAFAINVYHVSGQVTLDAIGIVSYALIIPIGMLTIYYVGGSFAHLLVLLSGGERGIDVSRRIAVFVAVPAHIVSLLVIGMRSYSEALFSGSEGIVSIASVMSVGVQVLAIMLTFTAFRYIKKTQLVRSLFFFIALPLVMGAIPFYKSYTQRGKLQAMESQENIKHVGLKGNGQFTNVNE